VTAGSAGLLAIDISDPVNPVIVDQCVLSETAYAVELMPGYAIVGAGYGGAVVVDISSVGNMFEADIIDLQGGIYSLAYDSDILYAGDGGGGISIVDFADPFAPELIEYRVASGYTKGLFISDGFLAVAKSHLGLELLPLQCGATSGIEETSPLFTVTALTLHGNYPNPFNPSTEISFSVPRAEIGRLDIYNVRGELVRNLYSGQFDAGAGSVVWNGRTDDGLNAGSGVYFYQLEVGVHTATKRMVLLK